MEKIVYNLKENRSKVSLPTNLGFGQVFTDHVFEIDYNEEKGWHNPSIKVLENLQMHPATMFIHYGQAVFDGLKAFKDEDGNVSIFRPERHLQRLNNSSRRLCIPEIDVEFVLSALKELIWIEKDWIPTSKGESLYIRPFIYGVDPFLGVKPASNYKLIILLSPVGAYYPEGFKPVKILVTNDYVRAVRKGIGECKTPANYAASLYAGEEAKKLGFTQVLWLDGVEQKYIEEVGTMNIFIRFKNEVATPKLSGSILPGVTRDSVIQLLKEWKMNITERVISIDEVVSEFKKGNVLEVFGTGTAAIVSMVGLLKYKEIEMKFDFTHSDNLAARLFDKITEIQYGKGEDKFNWLTHVSYKAVEV
ncbi:MAG: branched-chain amino acid aminotransferase [Ignavibacteriaceae bacterium]|nr:branched-chain amino acid aminotransferase [Ignavibacteriaceae bacterium]